MGQSRRSIPAPWVVHPGVFDTPETALCSPVGPQRCALCVRRTCRLGTDGSALLPSRLGPSFDCPYLTTTVSGCQPLPFGRLRSHSPRHTAALAPRDRAGICPCGPSLRLSAPRAVSGSRPLPFHPMIWTLPEPPAPVKPLGRGCAVAVVSDGLEIADWQASSLINRFDGCHQFP